MAPRKVQHVCAAHTGMVDVRPLARNFHMHRITNVEKLASHWPALAAEAVACTQSASADGVLVAVLHDLFSIVWGARDRRRWPMSRISIVELFKTTLYTHVFTHHHLTYHP